MGQTLAIESPRRAARIGTRRAPAAALIACAGHTYYATEEMARIFLRHAAEIVAAGGSELVPLCHLYGLEMLLISPRTPFSVLPHGFPIEP